MLLIADTSPLISLLLIQQLDLLERIFGEYYIPQAVLEELQGHQEIASFQKELEQLAFKVKYTNSVYLPLAGIEKGETEAIYLYQELNADLLLVDDKKAREVAELLSIQCTGTLAVLYQAKNIQLIPELRPLFLALLLHSRYYSKKILNTLLIEIGEQPI